MDWPHLIDKLRARGWTQALLAERLGIAQSAISDLRSGNTKDPKHSTGEALRTLYDSGAVAPRTTEHPAPEAQPAEAAGG